MSRLQDNENFPNDLLGSEPRDKSGYNLVRVIANADFHLGPVVRVFAQGISATEQGRAPAGHPLRNTVRECCLGSSGLPP
jgi:hypothetical protein